MRRRALELRVLAAAVAVAVAVGACGDAGAPASAWPSTIDLPRVATVGDLPRAARSCVITLDQDGNASVDGHVAADPVAVLGCLAERTGPRDGILRDRPGSAFDVVLALDGDAPWRSAAALLQACCDPSVVAGRVHFAVRGLDGDEPGGFVLELPLDYGATGDGTLKPPGPDEVQHVDVTIVSGAGAPAESLACWLAARPMRPRCTDLGIDAPEDAPVRFVLAVLDAACRGGATQANVNFARARPDGPRSATDRPYFQRLAATRGPWRVAVAGVATLPAPATPAPPARVRGGFAGFSAPWRIFLLEESSPEDPAEGVSPKER